MAFAMPALLPRCHLGGGGGKTLSAPYSLCEKQRVSPRSWGGSGQQSLAAGQGWDQGRGGVSSCEMGGVCLALAPGFACAGAASLDVMVQMVIRMCPLCSASGHAVVAVPSCF